MTKKESFRLEAAAIYLSHIRQAIESLRKTGRFFKYSSLQIALVAGLTFGCSPLESTWPCRGAERLLSSSVEEGAFPGAVLLVGGPDSVGCTVAVGRFGEDYPTRVSDSTVYDLASVTKVVGLTSAIMILVEEGKIELDSPVEAYLPEFQGAVQSDITIRHLLTHTSGLPGWRPIFSETTSRTEAIDSVLLASLESTPGSQYVYSDLGAITLGLVAEKVSGTSLNQFLEERLFGPLGMDWTRFSPPIDWLDRTTPTEYYPWRDKVVHGEVHDENAARLEGVAGHAGLFSIAPDLAKFASWMLDLYHNRVLRTRVPTISAPLVREFVSKQDLPPGSTRALGWDTPSEEGSSAGTLLSLRSFGHTGFTGTSMWIDPELELFVILLTNRVHPSRDNQRIRPIRGQVADSVVLEYLNRRN